MSVPKFIRASGQLYRLAQQGQDVSVLTPADYKLCKFVTDLLGGSHSRLMHDCTAVVEHFLELGYDNPTNQDQQEAFFEEALSSGWLTGKAPHQYAANVLLGNGSTAAPRYIKVRGQVYRRL